MAITVAITKVHVAGDRKFAYYTLTFDSSYPTGGEPLTAAMLGMDIELNSVEVDSALGYVLHWNPTDKVVLAYRQTDPAAVGGADVALVQVADTTNLSTLVTTCRAVGKGAVTSA